MIIETNTSELELSGDIKEFKTGIDPKNIDFVTTLLSSNLYSAPERSFIREIVSNAWDSQVEAGTTDVPVLIRFGKKDDKHFVTIRDFGTGLSPERFQEVYCNIGSSTKRTSNDYIGGFGIGKYSSLAVSNTVYVTSFYEGKAYHYIMVKSGGTITTNEVAVLDTTEKNGVEVTIKNISNIEPFKKALESIIFFPNVYVDGGDTDFNTTKVREYEKFKVASKRMEQRLLLGNVLYPIDTSQFETNFRQFFINTIYHTGIVFKFNIGELEVTPNRESIIYTERVKNIIVQRVSEAKQEIADIIKKKVYKDYTDIIEWTKLQSKELGCDLFDGSVSRKIHGDKGYPFSPISFGVITYKGEELRPWYSFIRDVVSLQHYKLKGAVYYDRVFTASNKFPRGVDTDMYHATPTVVIEGGDRLSSVAKEYLRTRFMAGSVGLIVGSYSFSDFKKYVEESLQYRFLKGDRAYASPDEAKKILRYIYDDVTSQYKHLNIATDENFLKFKEEAKIKPTYKSRNFWLYVYEKYGSNYVNRNPKKFTTMEAAVKFLKETKAGIVFGNVKTVEEEQGVANTVCPFGYTYITASKPVLAELETVELTQRVDIKDVWNKPVVQKLSTMLKEASIVGLSDNVLFTIPEPKKAELTKMIALYDKYRYWSSCLNHIRTLNIPNDPYYEKLCKEMKYYNSEYENIKTQYSLNGHSDVERPFIMALLMKKKRYRISKSAYILLTKNKLLNALWQKSSKMAS